MIDFIANNFSSLLSYLEAIEASRVLLYDLCNKKILNVNNLRVYIINLRPGSCFLFSQNSLYSFLFFSRSERKLITTRFNLGPQQRKNTLLSDDDSNEFHSKTMMIVKFNNL